MIPHLNHIRTRRAALKSAIDVDGTFELWKESCVPSYCHPNFAAAYVSWLRLFAAVGLAKDHAVGIRSVLDFGASVGELSHVLDIEAEYHFIEQDEHAAAHLMRNNPQAIRQTLDNAPRNKFDVVFAIDALEHNENYGELIGNLSELMAPGGIFVLSGPTENALYKLGRRIAGFAGDYHVASIYDIEKAAGQWLEEAGLKTVPLGMPLFRITAWQRR